MIDKQKLLTWIEDKKYVYGGPYDDGESSDELQRYQGVLMILRVLDQEIEWGRLDAEEVAHERSEASSVPSAS